VSRQAWQCTARARIIEDVGSFPVDLYRNSAHCAGCMALPDAIERMLRTFDVTALLFLFSQ
jgi:hypothetical protein